MIHRRQFWLPVSLAIGLIGIMFDSAATDKLDAILEKGLITKEALEVLTHDDVPEAWRASVVHTNTIDYTRKIYYRGKAKLLEVQWNTNWSGAYSN